MIGVQQLFRIGLGPSSSHTVGPMTAAGVFAERLAGRRFVRIRCTLLGSLAWTGKGHHTDRAVILGLAGYRPETAEPDEADAALARIAASKTIVVAGRRIPFDPDGDVVFDREAPTPVHPNTLVFTGFAADGGTLAEERWCSIGGGFVLPEDDVGAADDTAAAVVPYPFATAAELLAVCARNGLSIVELARCNEMRTTSAPELTRYLDRIIAAMMASIDRGMAADGVLPGKLAVQRRARALAERLAMDRSRNDCSPHVILDHVSMFAIAVNEENAAGRRIVTAPTNGAAGVIPAVLRYYRDFIPAATRAGMHDFLLAAGAIGGLIKRNASISGAEVGCQGEVGAASAMAAAGLAAALGASDRQIENSAEIAMEHHLGMTCDPIGGLVQIPCIERNAFGAVKAINAASLAMRGNGEHVVSLDQVIDTMRETGRDLHSKYKETSLGGLAVSFPEC